MRLPKPNANLIGGKGKGNILGNTGSHWKLAVYLFIAVAVYAMPTLVFAQAAQCSAGSSSIGSVACNATESFDNIFSLVSGLSYLTGALFAIRAAMHFKDHTDNPQQVKLSKPFTTLLVSALLLTLPSAVDAGIGTFFASADSASMSALYDAISGNGGTGPGASSSQDLGGMFVALSYSLPAMVKFVAIGAKLVGLMLLLKTIYMLPNYESGKETGSKVLWTFITAIGLYTFPILFTTVMETMGGVASYTNGASNPLTAAYAASSRSNDFNGAIASVLMFVQLLGVIAFVRGMLILKALGENKDGAMGRALTHIFGGAAAMNVSWAITMLANTIGAHDQICGIAQGVICIF